MKRVIFIFKKKLIGCAIAETIESAYKVLLNTTHDPLQPENPNRTNNQCIITKEPQPAIIGISRIWVHHQYRRQGIATALLDSIRNHFIYGLSVKKELIAVTQPSTEGQQFATGYFGTGEFLVYVP